MPSCAFPDPPYRPGMNESPAPWRERLFGDRGARLRAGLVLAALVASTVYAELAWEYVHPALDQCIDDPARHDGKTTYVGPARVEATDASGFTARNIRGTTVFVEAPPGTPAASGDWVAPGDMVAFRGVFRRSGAAGRSPGYIALDMEAGRPMIRPAPSGFAKRYGMFALSAAVLAYVAWRSLRAFRVTRQGIDLRSRIPDPGSA